VTVNKQQKTITEQAKTLLKQAAIITTLQTTANAHTFALKEHSTEVDALYNTIKELESRNSGWFFNPFLLLCTLVRVLYEINLTITWDLPSFTFPIMCDLPMSCKLISSPRLLYRS
jgi:hypothetical protein